MKLFKVRKGDYLHYPNGMTDSGGNRCWLRPGGVLDMDDPFVAHSVKGQEYKLEPAPDAEAPTEVRSQKLLLLRQRFEGAGSPPTKQQTKARELKEKINPKRGQIQVPDKVGD